MNDKISHINQAWKLLVAFTLLVLSPVNLIAQIQTQSFVKNFKAKYENEKIILSWSTKAGFTCQDIQVQLSSDTLTEFKAAGTIYGICGSEEKEESYFYVIENPLPNTVNYIRLELGTAGYSNTISLFALVPTQEVVITPHPLHWQGYFRLDNTVNEELEISIYTLLGKKLDVFYSKESKIPINSSAYPNGVLLYSIVGEELGLVRGQLLHHP